MKMRDIIKQLYPDRVNGGYGRGVAGCPYIYPVLFENHDDLMKKPNCSKIDCVECWDQEICQAEDCINCEDTGCILHPGEDE